MEQTVAVNYCGPQFGRPRGTRRTGPTQQIRHRSGSLPYIPQIGDVITGELPGAMLTGRLSVARRADRVVARIYWLAAVIHVPALAVTSEYSWCNPPKIDFISTSEPAANR